ncbi:MAG: LytTR family transcriptional regulator [Clostridiaceae bacterium]|jgi:DNA-binding LytR/AlgR family response regulator|nr:LytTR family transcriptional regulator [Clostridiaceae bacterium]
MLSIIVLDTMHDEEPNISDILEEAYSKRDLPVKRLAVFREPAPLFGFAEEQSDRFNVFIASFSWLRDEYMELAQNLRRRRKNLFIVFVVGRNVDISCCVRPSVRPSGILFIPLEKQRIYQTLSEIYVELLRSAERGEQPVFTIRCGGEYYTIDTEDIFFFEAQGKKIAAKTRSQEIAFYSNFEAVLEQLPEWFVRCHKGFVVNTKQIVQASFTEMTLTLKDRSVVPISRTYRDEIRTIVESKGAV